MSDDDQPDTGAKTAAADHDGDHDKDPTEVESTAVELDEPTVATETDREDAPAARPRRRLPAIGVTAIVLAVALVAATALTTWLYFNQYRPDQQTDDAVADTVLAAAKDGAVALLSYSPDSLEQDFTAAKSRLTGDFLSYYTQFTQDIVTPAAKQKALKTTASVVRAAVSRLDPSAAEVLLFINQNTTSKENPDGAFAMSAVRVGLIEVDGTWLISSFEPV